MGSLFDGIGDFPLAAVRNGIRPVWASEIEAFPIEVTKLTFPDMVHVGDITRLNGAELPPVNIICGGSPCQDLSVAGARAGLAGARSGLFMEQVRLTKEMRNADELRGRTAVAAPLHLKLNILHGGFLYCLHNLGRFNHLPGGRMVRAARNNDRRDCRSFQHSFPGTALSLFPGRLRRALQDPAGTGSRPDGQWRGPVQRK